MHGTALRPRTSRPRTKPLRNRHARKPISYREKSSDGDDFNEDASEDEYGSAPSAPQQRYPQRRVQPPPQRVRRKRRSSGRRPLGSMKIIKTSHTTSANGEVQGAAIALLPGKAMPWQTLPYHVWLSIFDYASRPLISDMFQPMPSINWLVQVALCCKAFAEPALSVLYYSPPLSPPARAYRLLEQLATQPVHSTYNYRAKIKYLEPEASGALLYKFSGHEPIDLGAFAAFTPQLRGIGVHLLSDNPRLRKGFNLSRSTNGRGVYQRSLFVALEDHKVALQEWTWNQSLGKQTTSLSGLKEIHTMSPFRTLRNVCFVNYDGSLLGKATSREDTLAEALSILPDLRSLSFKMCSIVGDRLMPLLPANLQALDIYDCALLRSSALNAFLSIKGNDLRRLNLDHNIALNLSFLADLAKNCPNLRQFRMDLVYFNTYATVRDSDPKYNVLFDETERPSWPTSLETLELYHLRKWSLPLAETLFSSLTDAASSLPNLRQLRIKASLEASGWRDRVVFRDRYTHRLRHVFLRRSAPPNPHLKSISAFNAFQKERSNNDRIGRGRKRSLTLHLAANKKKPTAQRSHVKSIERATKEEDSDSDLPLIRTSRNDPADSDSNAPLAKLRRSTRSKLQKEDMYTLSESSPQTGKTSHRRRHRKGSAESSSEDSALDEDVVKPISQGQSDNGDDLYVQGMCDVVDVWLDNQRPAEEQLREEDFIDDEASGDEDWNGDDDMPDGGGYAW